MSPPRDRWLDPRARRVPRQSNPPPMDRQSENLVGNIQNYKILSLLPSFGHFGQFCITSRVSPSRLIPAPPEFG